MTIDNTQDIIDIRDIIARIEELEEFLEQTHADQGGEAEFSDWIEADWSEADFAYEEVIEYQALTAIMDDLKGNGGDEQWRGEWYPITLIRESYFKDFAQELAEDIGAVDSNASWPNNCIDWDYAARELKHDYTSTEIDGVTYLYR